MTMPPFHKILTTAALCLAAVGLSSCQEIADGVCNVTGAKMPKGWVPSVPKKDISFSQPNGWQGGQQSTTYRRQNHSRNSVGMWYIFSQL